MILCDTYVYKYLFVYIVDIRRKYEIFFFLFLQLVPLAILLRHTCRLDRFLLRIFQRWKKKKNLFEKHERKHRNAIRWKINFQNFLEVWNERKIQWYKNCLSRLLLRVLLNPYVCSSFMEAREKEGSRAEDPTRLEVLFKDHWINIDLSPCLSLSFSSLNSSFDSTGWFRKLINQSRDFSLFSIHFWFFKDRSEVESFLNVCILILFLWFPFSSLKILRHIS